MADSGLGQETYKMYLEQLVISESGEAVLPKSTREQTDMCSHYPKMAQSDEKSNHCNGSKHIKYV